MTGSRWSVRARLTVSTAGVLAAMVVVSALVARQAGQRAVHSQLDASMAASAALVREFFRSELGEYRTVEATLAHIGTELVFSDRRIDFLRPDGQRFVVPGSPERVRVALPPPTQDSTFALDPELAPDWRVRVVASRAASTDILRSLDLALGLGVPLALLAVGAVAWALVGRTLAPVGAMASAAQRVTSAASGVRLPVANPRDELGQLGGTINALLDRLDGALTQQRQFVADAAHELRTPLARLRASLDLARSAPATERDALLASLRTDVAAMAQLVDELLLLARADADGVPPATTVGYLDDLVHDALPRWHAAATAAGLALSVAALEEAPIRMDAPAIERLLGILLDNAIRYTPAPGRVEVSVRLAGDRVTLEVLDDGIGIPPADRARVTQRFVRGAQARQRTPDGAGLGLAIAAATASAHGATLTLDSGLAAADRVGTAVRITFPLAAVQPPVPAVG